MSDKRISEIKSEDKKALKGSLWIIIVSGIAGALFSRISDNFNEGFLKNLSDFLMNILEQITPYASTVLSIVVIIVARIVYIKSRKEYELWKQRNEDDDAIDKIEEKLSYIILVTNVNVILGYFFVGAGVSLLNLNDAQRELDMIKGSWLLVGLILCVVSSTLIQKNVVNLQKEINPLLKGSVYDSKFSEKWLESCDESIKLSIYKSSYKSFKSSSTTCAILWVFCIIGAGLWNWGIMPLVMVSIIWLVLTVSYCIESIKISKIR